MTDYNDGNWHGWNGGECPVHPKTAIDIWDATSGTRGVLKSKHVHWSFRGAFRVVKEHREPREWLVWECADGSLIPSGTEAYGAFKVREVIE